MNNFFNFVTNDSFLFLRRLFRLLGLNKYIFKLFFLNSDPEYYENHFKNLMISKIKHDDCVWDIGANIGHYSIEFANNLSDQGEVISFEPSSTNFEKLEANTSKTKKISCKMIALSDKNEEITMLQGDDNIGATTKVINENKYNKTEKVFKINAIKGDELVSRNECSKPSFLKIDTEGYEYEILQGLESQLFNNYLRVICIEVHFTILEERKKFENVEKIKKLLRKYNYQIQWVDFSHLIAFKE